MADNKSSIVYQCKIFDVREEEVTFPNGKTARQSWINHHPTVAIVAVNEKNELLLIKQYRNAVKQDLLEIPAGSLDGIEESPAVCAQRELAEETGFKAKSLIKLYEGYLLPGYCNEYMYFFWPLIFSAHRLIPTTTSSLKPYPPRFPKHTSSSTEASSSTPKPFWAFCWLKNF